eukprot:scaffold41408_cov66-Phaeocystis_antarctica.AAC.4
MAATCNAVVCVPMLRTFTSQPASTRSRTIGSKSQVTAAHSGLVPSASSASKSVSSMPTRNSTMLCCPLAQADASEACVWIISPSVRRGRWRWSPRPCSRRRCEFDSYTYNNPTLQRLPTHLQLPGNTNH